MDASAQTAVTTLLCVCKSFLPRRPKSPQKYHNYILTRSSFHLIPLHITLFSSARTSSMSFWLCWSDKQPRTCFSDSSNSSNSVRKTHAFTLTTSGFHMSTYTRQKLAKRVKHLRFTLLSDDGRRQPACPGFRLMCVCERLHLISQSRPLFYMVCSCLCDGMCVSTVPPLTKF